MKPIKSELLLNQVYRALWEEIVKRNLKPNEKLDINLLAETLEVSRTPIMDALVQLEQEGLVIRRNRVGTFVTALTAEHFEHSFNARDMVEQFVTPTAIANITPEDEKSLRSTITEFDRLTRETDEESFDYASYTRIDHDFHLALINLCENPKIIDFYRSLNSHMQIARAYSRNALSRAAEGTMEHEQILEAFLARDVPLARQLQHEHLERSQAGVMQIVNKLGFL